MRQIRRIVVAPNAFKNSLSSPEAAVAITRGLKRSGIEGEIRTLPIADGGDDTLEVLIDHFGGYTEWHQVEGPLGKPVSAPIGYLEEGRTAVIELAKASGLGLLQENELNPMRASTFGTGQLIMHALDREIDRVIVGLGGSATVDAGTGLLRALGLQFTDAEGQAMVPSPANIQDCVRLEASRLDRRLSSVRVVVLCDVENTLLGEFGAAPVFGPQKGASKDQVQMLETFLSRFAELAEESLAIRLDGVKHGGAAGGTAAGLTLLPDVELVSGIEFLVDWMDFDRWIKWADLLITAEGKLDSQTVSGKGPMGIARLAGKYQVPVIGLAGEVEGEPEDFASFTSLFAIGSGPKSLEEAIQSTQDDLERVSMQIGRMLKVLGS